MDLAKLDGIPLTLWLTDEQGDSAVFAGVARWNGSNLVLDRGQNASFEIRPDWYKRIQPVLNEQVRKILMGADYYLRLYVGNLPRDDDESSYERTGLKWPK